MSHQRKEKLKLQLYVSNLLYLFEILMILFLQRESVPPDVPIVPYQHCDGTNSCNMENGDNSFVQHHPFWSY